MSFAILFLMFFLLLIIIAILMFAWGSRAQPSGASELTASCHQREVWFLGWYVQCVGGCESDNC